MCKECDLAYDKARMQVKMHAMRKNRPKKEAAPKQQPKEEVMRTLVLRLNADTMPLSQVLEIKKIFRSFSGKSAVELQFVSSEKQVAKISIDPSWGVDLTSELKNQLEALPAIIDILAESR